MRTVLRMTVVLAAAVLSIAGATFAATPAEKVAAANAVEKQFLAAFNKADLDALMATYWKSPDLVFIDLGGMGVRGWDAAKAGWQEALKGLTGAKLEITESHNTAFGETVLGWGRWKMTIPAAQGAPQVMEGRFSDVKAFRDGKWVYVMDHASVPIPPPPPPARK
ncbi:MAG: nuclear transport factor 2 family protein [Acidobacteria bacterium]|nr:nuclear transport factor 2 family protein [Acidobacteriota bacterium]